MDLESIAVAAPERLPAERDDAADPRPWLEAFDAGVGSPLELKFLRLFQEHGLEVTLAGDAAALRIAADRLWPALSRQEVGGQDGRAIEPDPSPDLSDLTNEELRQLEAIALAREQRAAAARNGASSIDQT